MKIANIVTKNDLKVDSVLNVYSDIYDIDNDLPTLIVGWKQMIEDFPKQPILINKIKENLFWCCSKFEDRSKYNIEMEKFIQLSFDKLMDKYKFYYVDLVNLKLDSIKKIINKIKLGENIITFYDENDIIIFCDGIIFSLNLNVLIFLKVDIDKLKNKLNRLTKTILPNKLSHKLNIKYSDRIYEDKSYIPVLYSLSEK